MATNRFKNRASPSSAGTLTDAAVFVGLFLVLLIVRFPSFFFSVFDWDESTFIIVAQSILDGKMPYVDAWDIKPPLAYYVYASFITLFGKSIFSVRLGGALCLYTAAALLYKTGKALSNRTGGLIAALFLIVFASSGRGGLSTMTEHILLVPVCIVLYFLFTSEIDRRIAFVVGIILGVAILVKTNMVFETIAVFLILSLGFQMPGIDLSERLKRGIILSAGTFLPVLATIYFYLAGNHLDLLFKTNVTAVLGYVGSEASSLLKKSEILFLNIRDGVTTNPLLWMTFVLGTVCLAFFNRINRSFLLSAITIFLAQISSLFFAAQPFGYHYLITSLPVMSLISGVAISHSLSGRQSGRRVYLPLSILIIASGMLYSLQGSVVKHYGEIFSRLSQKQPLSYDACYKIALFLEMNGAKDNYVYMVNSCQIVYWLTESRHPTKYIHPSNLMLREYMLKAIDGPDATKERELQAILNKQPKFIVARADLWPDSLGEFKAALDKELTDHYEIMTSVDTYYQIYRRKNLR